MLNFNCTLNTAGDGYWSDVARPVQVTGLQLNYINEEETFGELIVFFSDSTWTVETDGLIYTDTQFLEELRTALVSVGFAPTAARDVDYSEQGMQEEHYVSLDVGAEFLKEYARLAPQEYLEQHEICNG